MARIRTIKPEFCTDPVVGMWPPLSRLLYVGLWMHADDEGRLKYHPLMLVRTILPFDNVDPDEVIRPIVERGKLVVYEEGGEQYGWIPSFAAHQRINRPTPSKLPPPPQETDALQPLTEDSLRTHGGLTEDSLPERKGKERIPPLPPPRGDVGAGAPQALTLTTEPSEQRHAEAQGLIDHWNNLVRKPLGMRPLTGQSWLDSAEALLRYRKGRYSAVQAQLVAEWAWANRESSHHAKCCVDGAEYTPQAVWRRTKFHEKLGKAEAWKAACKPNGARSPPGNRERRAYDPCDCGCGAPNRGMCWGMEAQNMPIGATESRQDARNGVPRAVGRPKQKDAAGA